MEGTSKKKKK